jgi:hypothetical protein
VKLYAVCEFVALADLRFSLLSRRHFLKLSDYDEIPLCKILCLAKGTGLLAE